MAHPQQQRRPPPPRGPPPGRQGGGSSRQPPSPRDHRYPPNQRPPPPPRAHYDQGDYAYDGHDDYQYDRRGGGGYGGYPPNNYHAGYDGYDYGYGGYDRPAPRPPPPRQAQGRPNRGPRDINHGMGAMDLSHHGDRRPHTSNSSRRRPPPQRQHTAPPPMSSKTPPPHADAGRRTADHFRGQDDRMMHPPKRSATMPVSRDDAAPPGSGRPQYPGQSTWQDPNSIPPGSSEDDQRYDPTSELLDDYFEFAGTSEPDMPNFDAMNGSGAGTTPAEEHLIPVDASRKQSESKGAYAAYRPPPGTADDQQQFDGPGPPGSRRGPPPTDYYDYPGEYDRGRRPDGRGMPPGGGQRGAPRGRARGGPPEPPPKNHGAGGGPMYGDDPQNQYSGPDQGYQDPRDQQPPGGGIPAPGRVGSPPNPDALPHHPAPYRPGLGQGSGKPSPARQHDNQPPAQQQLGQAPPPPPKGPDLRQGPDVVTHEELRRLQQAVSDKPNDHATQLTLAKKLVEASVHLIDDNGRADTRTKNKNREKYVVDAHKIVKKLVGAGYGEAMFYLADCYGQGHLGLEVDPKEAHTLYQSAAKLGHPEAAYRLAVCCEMGYDGGGGTRQDAPKAVQWYRRAAALGDTPAMYKMGVILLKGILGQQKNPREALSWLKRAAERADEDNPHALHELALLYQNPQGNEAVIRDESYSHELLTQAANLGYKFSQFRLGAAYEYGSLGRPIDPRQSIFWYTRAAAQGEHQSELSLSGWYLTGSEGILQQSDTEAYLWARKAAVAGLAKAEYAMGYYSEVGIGSPANLDDAKRWYWKASSQNFLKARERLEDLRRGGATKQKTRLSRSAVKKEHEGDCVVM